VERPSRCHADDRWGAISTVRRGIGFFLGIALCALLSREARAESAADVALARQLFTEGVELAQAGRWEEARERYRRSLALKRAPLTLYSLGVADQNLGRLVEALESFRAYLIEMDPKNEAHKPYEQPARDAIAELAKRVGTLELRLAPPGIVPTHVVIDGEELPKAAIGVPRIVDPGKHKVMVRAEGRRDAEKTLEVAEGQRVFVDLTLLPIPPKRGGGEIKPPPPPPPPLNVRPLVLMGAGGAVFISGLAIGLVGVQKASDAPSQKGPEADVARKLGLVGDIVSGVGLAAAGAGLAWMLATMPPAPKNGPEPKEEEEPEVSVRPFVSPGMVGVVGRF